MHKFEIVIVGGGISGAIAGIAAARLKKKVLIAEKNGFLGGMLTAGGVGPMMTFHAGEKKVVCGITDELISRLVGKGKSPGHIFDTTGYTYSVTPFDAETMKHELEIMFLEAGGQLLYHSMLGSVKTENKRISSIELITKSNTVDISANTFIDATGDAELSYRAGVPCTIGRDTDNACQPMTMNFKMINVDIEKVRAFITDENNIKNFPRIDKDLNIVERASRLSIGGFNELINEAYEKGKLSFNRGELLFFETNTPGEVIINTTRVTQYSPIDPWEFSKAEIEGRKQVRELKTFIKTKIPGFENSVITQSGPVQIGVRSSRQIEGVYTLNEYDLISQKKFIDAIAHGGYPIDIHPPKGKYQDGFSFDKLKLPYGAVYSVPYRSLVNNYVDNLITVGRCISTTFVAQGAIRVSPIAGAVGHAGGIGAALAVKQSCVAREVNKEDLRNELIKQNAYLI